MGFGFSPGVAEQLVCLSLSPSDGVGRNSFSGDHPHCTTRTRCNKRGDSCEREEFPARSFRNPRLAGPGLGGRRQTTPRVKGQPLERRRRRSGSRGLGRAVERRRLGREGKKPRIAVWGGRMNLREAGGAALICNQSRFRLPHTEACTPRNVAALLGIALAQTCLRSHHEQCRVSLSHMADNDQPQRGGV